MKILVINGPNLNMLGMREPKIYGSMTLADIENMIKERIADRAEAEFFQSNCEGFIIDRIHKLDYDALIINAGAYSHYSYAIADALKIATAKKIEVHMSDIYAREEFRKKSVLSAVCDVCITGFGADSYLLAVDSVL